MGDTLQKEKKIKRPRDAFVAVNGVRLHFVDWGGEGPPAVLHHATGFHARVWDPIAGALTRRFHVVALDARGHGDSEKPESGYRWDVLISDLVALLDELGWSGVLGVGHSLGGSIVLGAAAARPELFRSLVLLDPIFFPREHVGLSETDNPMVAAARKRRQVWPDREAIFESYRARAPFDSWQESCLRSYVDHGTEHEPGGGVRLKCPGAIEAQVFAMASEHDAWSDCDLVGAPTLVIRGETSTALTERDGAEIVGRLARGRLISVGGSGHHIPFERPEAVIAAIESFVTEDDGGLPIATRGLAHLALRVRDVERVAAFYGETFGMRVVWRPDPDNVYLSSGRDNLALHRTDAVATDGALDHLGFLVDSPGDVFAAAEALERRGVPLVRPPRRHRDGSCSFYVADPEGNVVQVLYTPGAAAE